MAERREVVAMSLQGSNDDSERPTPDPLRAFTLREVADRLNVGLSTVTRMVQAGEIEVFRPRGRGKGRPVRVTEAALFKVFYGRHNAA
ncbi:helix-turn-helix domain-containing protein [Microbacterium galbinum]|uniref:Helix-turn-helix domain-containing protein n=1 Tax=Microbacterium galbinum TaxID=2851646 RepID=A0ABY4IW18_9MICO|nr:helix-turn-helix domain-containing protein [Microbacterium galbinum]